MRNKTRENCTIVRINILGIRGYPTSLYTTDAKYSSIIFNYRAGRFLF